MSEENKMDNENKFDAIVVCSTLNQMVNYLTIKEHEHLLKDEKNIISIGGKIEKIENYDPNFKSNFTYNNKFNYFEWNNNLNTVLNIYKPYNIRAIEFNNNEIKKHKSIINKLKKSIKEEEKILWNITGGQRHFVMAITQYVLNERADDVIIYFDGDTEQYYYYGKNTNKVSNKNNEAMNIEIALKLMGFDSSKDDRYKVDESYEFLKNIERIDGNYEIKLKNEDENENKHKKLKQEFKLYNKLIDKIYGKEDKVSELMKILIYLNKPSDYIKKGIEKNDDLKSRFEKKGDYNKLNTFEKLEIFLNGNYLNSEELKILDESLGEYKKGKIFGYILENMTFYRIIYIISREFQNEIADIRFDHSSYVNKENIDQFDILLLTKKGKLINFECKSGGMVGDNAKSNNYSTYAISGVYGTPVLIAPFYDCGIKGNIEYLDEKDLLKHIRTAYNSAKKAKLDICSVEELGKYLEKILKK